MNTEITRTETHEFQIFPCRYAVSVEAFEAQYRSLNPKTGHPWQAPKKVTEGATIEPQGWAGRPIAYPTIEAARAAVERQKLIFAKRRPKA